MPRVFSAHDRRNQEQRRGADGSGKLAGGRSEKSSVVTWGGVFFALINIEQGFVQLR